MATTANLNLQLPDTGALVNTWGPVINGNFSTIDNRLSNETGLTFTSNAYTMTVADVQAMLLFPQTSSVTANATLLFPVGVKGVWLFLNVSSYSITIGSNSAATSGSPASGETTLAAGSSGVLYCDGTNVFNITPSTTIPTHIDIPAGTVMTFMQPSAPSGWTLSTAINDAVLRVNSTTGAGTGGSWAISGLTVEGTAITIDQMPAHTHTVSGLGSNATAGASTTTLTQTDSPYSTTSSTGGSNPHTHTLTSDEKWRPAYVDVIAATRNA